MGDHDENERWQVSVNEQVYEASFVELTEWIAEGSLLPTDKVRRGYLRWIEAGKVPPLARHFESKTMGTSLVVVNGSDATASGIVNGTQSNGRAVGVLHREHTPVTSAIDTQTSCAASDSCSIHPEREAEFVCTTCNKRACRECINSFGSSVSICGSCGGMTRSRAEVQREQRKESIRATAIERGFGISDFAEAILYPFRFKTSLVVGAVMFLFFSIGQGATMFGGVYMIVAAIFSYMLANMLAFGILANTIETFANGAIGKNFMPDFDDFSLWDDVVHPFFLSIGVWISSFGPFAVVLLLGMCLVMSSVSGHMDTVKTNLERTPGTPYYNVRDTFDQSNQVKSVLENANRINQQHLEQQAAIENRQSPQAINTDENVDGLNKMIAESKRKELESVLGSSPETRERESAAFMAGLFQLPAPIVVIGFITFLWGLVYFPAACVVAGYTRSVTATLNPMVGIDTARRLGMDYIRLLLMSGALVTTFLVVKGLVGLILAPFDMPGVGNVPANAMLSVLYFYLAIVFSCTLGLVVFKRSEQLSLFS